MNAPKVGKKQGTSRVPLLQQSKTLVSFQSNRNVYICMCVYIYIYLRRVTYVMLYFKSAWL